VGRTDGHQGLQPAAPASRLTAITLRRFHLKE
jgi:hypothetical protein